MSVSHKQIHNTRITKIMIGGRIMSVYYKEVLRLFKGVLTDEHINEIPDEEALKYGVYIFKDFPEEVKKEAIKQYGRNGEEANQTFHKSLFKVAEADEIQLYFEQLVHYLTTYGAEQLGIYDSDTVFIPKEKLEIPELLEDTKLVVIKPITESELKDRIKEMITSNIALSKQTVKDIVALSDYIDVKEYSEGDNYLCKIQNKEVRSALYGKFGILPKRGDEFLRYFIAKKCDTTLLIKSKELEREISWVSPAETLELLKRYKEQYGLENLSKVFNRFKPLFLSMKSHPKDTIAQYYRKEDLDCMTELNKYINYISKSSKKYHTPMRDNDLNKFVEWVGSLDSSDTNAYKKAIYEKFDNAGIYTAIRILNYLKREKLSKLDFKLYKIRNGKIYVKDNTEIISSNLTLLQIIVENYIVEHIKQNVNGKTVYIPNEISYRLPQSEKQYTGNIPFGSVVTVDKQPLLVGIHWCNVKYDDYEHRVDLDLHLTSNNRSYGWNAGYRSSNNSIIFTGDNTDAPLPKGSSEFMYISNDVADKCFELKINNYTRDVGPIPYEIIIGKANPNAHYADNRNFIIDPNDILVKIPMQMELGQAEQVVGIISMQDTSIDLIMTDLVTSNQRVSNNKEFSQKIRTFILEQSRLQMDLKRTLLMSGANIVDKPYTITEVPYVYTSNNIMVSQEIADKEGIEYLPENIYTKKEKVPVDIDFSLESLTKDSFIKLLKE